MKDSNKKAVIPQMVVGFCFCDDDKRVLLIKKKRPAWQAGKFNGIGGKIEPGERPHFAMEREFHEEAGLRITRWKKFCELYSSTGHIHFYTHRAPVKTLQKAKAQTDEELQLVAVEHLPAYHNVIPNLRWLIPMVLSLSSGETAVGFTIIEINET